MSDVKKPTFEDDLAALERIVTQLESGDLSLDQALQAFESGVKLTRQCQDALASAEQKVQILITKNGSSELQSFIDPTNE